MAESHNELTETKRRIIEEEGMTEERYKERADQLEQNGLDMETFRDIARMVNNRATTTEDAKVARIKEVCSSREELLSAVVQQLTLAGVPLENRIRRKKGRGT